MQRARLLLLATLPFGLAAQDTPAPGAVAVLRGQWDRWLFTGQREAGVDLERSLVTVRIDSVTRSPTGRVLHAVQGNQAVGTVRFDSSGRFVGLTARLLPSPPSGLRRPDADHRQQELWRRFEGMSQMNGRLWLAEARFWPLAYAFRPAQAAVGARWSDTLRLRATDLGLRQEMDVVRHSVITGDTVVDGRRLWLVRDSAVVRLLERFTPIERDAMRTRNVTGIEIGRMAWDPVAGHPRWRDDSLRASGSIEDSLPDGRIPMHPTRFERFRRIAFLPAPEGRDAQRRWIEADLVAEAPAPRPRPSELLATGDTAAALDALAHRTGYDAVLDAAEARVVVLALDNPARALAWRANSSFLEQDTRNRLLQPVPALTPDTSRWRCTPEACRILAEAWPGSSETELRSLGLVARFALDPRQWADTILAREAGDPERLRTAAWLVRGVGATWPAASHAPLPGAGADWPAWVEWMDGRSAEYGRLAIPGRDTTLSPVRLRFGDSHLAAIRMRELLTGRRVQQELASALATATSDTARAVYRFLLTRLGAPQEPTDQIAARFTSDDPVVRDAARREVSTLLARAPIADSATMRTLQAMVLEAAIDGAGPLSEPRATGTPRFPRYAPRAGDSVYIRAHALHPDLRARWARVGTMLTDSGAVEPRDRFPVSVYAPGEVRRAGVFARVRFSFWQWVPGARAAPSPGAWITDHELDLMWNGERWVVVGGSQMIT